MSKFIKTVKILHILRESKLSVCACGQWTCTAETQIMRYNTLSSCNLNRKVFLFQGFTQGMDWLEENQDIPEIKYTYLPDSEIFMHSDHCHEPQPKPFVLPLSPKYNIQDKIYILFAAIHAIVPISQNKLGPKQSTANSSHSKIKTSVSPTTLESFSLPFESMNCQSSVLLYNNKAKTYFSSKHNLIWIIFIITLIGENRVHKCTH